MSKQRDTAAERIWREKLDERGSWGEAVALLILTAVVGAVMLITSV